MIKVKCPAPEREYVCKSGSSSDLCPQHSGAVTGYVLLVAFVEVALSVLVHAGLTGALGAHQSRAPPDRPARPRARDSRRGVLVLIRGRLELVQRMVSLYPLDIVGCLDKRTERERVTRYGGCGAVCY